MDEGLRARIRDRLLAHEPALLAPAPAWETRVRVREAVSRHLAMEEVALAPAEVAELVREISDGIVGLGPLEPLLRDPAVTEVMVNGPERVYVERDGRVERAAVRLADDAAVRHLIDRIVAPLGLRVDASSPWVDARLADGSRVHAIVPPVAVGGPTVTIRRFSRVPMTVEQLIERGMLSSARAAMLVEAVRARRTLIVSGPAAAGKTTLLGALAATIPAAERVITIEDAAELRLGREHVVALETRPANVEGTGRVTTRDLVRNALRMRPDRLVVGEVRGAEVLDMLAAMNTGHDGSMSTAHANSPSDLLARLESMAISGEAIPLEAVRRQMAAALDLVVHVGRAADGRRVVTAIGTVESRLDGSLRVREEPP